MTCTQQITPFTCGLACVESVTTDLGRPITQCELLNRYKGDLYRSVTSGGEFHDEHVKFGCTNSPLLMGILIHLGFIVSLEGAAVRTHVELKALMEESEACICTALFHKGTENAFAHTFRFSRFLEDGKIEVMDPGFFRSDDFAVHDFADLLHGDLEILLVSVPPAPLTD